MYDGHLYIDYFSLAGFLDVVLLYIKSVDALFCTCFSQIPARWSAQNCSRHHQLVLLLFVDTIKTMKR